MVSDLLASTWNHHVIVRIVQNFFLEAEPLANCLCTATKADVEAHFNTHGTGEITEIKLMNGFGFIEYKDAMDARDVVPGTLSACLWTNPS